MKNYNFKNLFSFSVLNFSEKFLAYVCPLLIVHIFEDQNLYNEVELIYSFSIIFNILFDFGLRGYFIYSLRKIKRKKQYSTKVLNYFNSLFLMITIVSVLILSILFTILNKSQIIIFSLVYLRFTFLYITFFFKVYFRMVSNPFYIFFLTIPVNLFVLIFILFGLYFKSSTIDLIIYFLPFIIFLIIYIVYLILNLKFIINLNKIIKFIRESLKFYWPIISISIISLFIGNFIKIFSFYELSSEDMTKSALFLRILMIIQLIHASFASFYLKKNFLEKKIDKRILKIYLVNISIVTFIIYLISPVYFNYLKVDFTIDIIFILLSMYTYLWCIASYLEQFLTKFNFNKSILKYYLTSSIFYFFLLILSDTLNLFNISIAMFLSSLIYFTCVIYKVNKINLLR